MSEVRFSVRCCWIGVWRPVKEAALVVGETLLAISMLVGIIAGQVPTADRWHELQAANNLDNEGDTPFHLQMTFQLYGDNGRSSETGTVDEWWASSESRQIVVSSPVMEGFRGSLDAHPQAMRASFLVRELIDAAVHPVQTEATPDEAARSLHIEFGKVELDCAQLAEGHEPLKSLTQPVVCTKPQSDDVLALMSSDGIERAVRGSTGTFHGVYVGLQPEVAFNGQKLISGKVTILQVLKPDEIKSESQAPEAATSTALPTRVPADVMAKRRVKFVLPGYPPIATLAHMSGTVMLGVVVGENGKVKSLVTLAASNPMFPNYAEQAVKQWVYQPYLLNGVPTEVGTTITVNFALNGR